uniref:Histone-lysine N-methyltransferase SMYD3-4 n=1 Tax=Brachionus koreanus TaxID=1199090 RepID=A0A513TZI3_9BILA|nr:histone-lysine N-methyltransferase SMYD3-4 [Brachionus koreanus]
MFFRKDQTVMEELPFVAVIDPAQNKNYCGQCFQNIKVTECPSCQQISYCSRKCERDDIIHKKECLAFKNCSERENCKDLLENDLLRLFLRILIRTQMNIDSDELTNFYNLTDEYDNILKDKERIQQLEFLKCAIRTVMGNEFLADFSKKDLVSLYGKMVIHKTDIKAGNNTIGIAIYLDASKFKHSCQPSLNVSFSGSKLILKANRPMTQNESPTISICDTNLSDSERKTYLKKFFYFDCHCSKCIGVESKIQASIPSLKFNEKDIRHPELNLAVRMANKFCETFTAKCIFSLFQIDSENSIANAFKTKILFEARPSNDKKYMVAWTYRDFDPYTIYINEIFKKRLEILNANAQENIEEIETITFYLSVLILHELAHLLFRWKGDRVSPEKIREAGIKLEDWLFGGKVTILTHPGSNWSPNSKHYGIRIKKIVTDTKYSRLSYDKYINKICHFEPDEDFELYTTLFCDDIKNEIDTLTLKGCSEIYENNSQDDDDPDIDENDIYETMYRKCLFH